VKSILLLLLLAAIEFPLCGGSPYNSTGKTNKNKYIKETIRNHSKYNTKTQYKNTTTQNKQYKTQ
jgi:hypothetical protein